VVFRARLVVSRNPVVVAACFYTNGHMQA
jgi:hypothetical protein